MLKNIADITKEKLDTVSQEAVLDENDRVLLSENDWVEQDEIRFLKRPLKVHYSPWSYYTLGCAFLMAKVYDPEFWYIYAFSTTAESTKNLKKLYLGNALKQKGYYYVERYCGYHEGGT